MMQMANLNCLRCGGSGILADGSPCPECSKEEYKVASIFMLEVPQQYMGMSWNTDALPVNVSNKYKDEMDSLLRAITMSYSNYSVNHLICYPNGNGKSIWSYTLLNNLYMKGVSVFGIIDLLDCREIMKSYEKEQKEKERKLSNSKLAIIRIPRDIQIWHFDIMQTVLERRVQKGNFTIFLFSGFYSDLERFDRMGSFKHLKGDGTFNSIRVHDFK